MHNKGRVLLVDDDPQIVRYLQSALREGGFYVSLAGDGCSAVHVALAESFDVVVLEIELSCMDGFDVCSHIRAESEVPILMLSARNGLSDRVRALDLGADDYLSKPFALEELLARMRSVMRRTRQATGGDRRGSQTQGNLTIDFATRAVSIGHENLQLTPTEYSLLVELATNCGRVMTHKELLLRVWGPEYTGDTEYLHVFISRLRRKFALAASAAKCLSSVPGVGYVLTAPGSK